MHKNIISAFLAVACFVAYGYDSVQLTYRGHLKYNDLSAPRPSAVAMTFRLYAGKSDTTASWTTTVASVQLDSEGFFQVALSGNGLEAVIDSGKAEYIGVTVADGKEQYPRQQLLSSAKSEKSEKAAKLAPSPSVGTVSVTDAEFDSISVGNISVGGAVNLPGSDQMLITDVKHTKKDFVLKTKGTVTMFRQQAPVDLGTAVSSSGGVSFSVAGFNCAAFFTSVGSTAMPGLVRLVKKDEVIAVPSDFALPDGLTVHCWLYPIGAE